MTDSKLLKAALFFGCLALTLCYFIFGAHAQSTNIKDMYGVVLFSSRDHYTHEGLVADWDLLDPFATGDLTNTGGDMETGRTASGCNYCPTGFTCLCNASHTYLRDEDEIIYKNNYSVRATTDGVGATPFFYFPYTLEPNTAYQFSVAVRGELGTEDILLEVADVTIARYYNFATDAWQAGLMGAELDNISTTWTVHNYYVLNDATTKNARFYVMPNNVSQTWYVDDFQVRKLQHLGPTSDTGYTLVPAVTADPVFGDNAVGLAYRGQATKAGARLDGTTDYIRMAVDDPTFDPDANGGDFTACFDARLDSSSTFNSIFGKYATTGDQRGWGIYYASVAGTYSGTISKTGLGTAGNYTSRTVTKAVGPDARGCLYYKNKGDRASVLSLKLDHETLTTVATAVAPIFNSSAPLSVGYFLGLSYLQGYVTAVAYWSRTLSDIEVSKYISPYFPDVSQGPGFYVNTCTQATAHATCSASKCRDGTPNRCEAEGTGALAMFFANTELKDNNSFETNTGTPETPVWTGWNITQNPATGAISVTDYLADSKHGSHAIRIKTTGDDSYAWVDTGCVAMLPNTTYTLQAAARTLSGDPHFMMGFVGYSDAGCTLNLDSHIVAYAVTPGVQWEVINGTAFTTAATTNFGKFYFESERSEGDILIDTTSFKAYPQPTPWMHCPSGSGSCAYTGRDYRLTNVLGNYNPTTGLRNFEDGYCVGSWVYADWAGDDGESHLLLATTGTGGASNNRMALYKHSGDYLIFTIYDSVAAIRSRSLTGLTAAEWVPGTAKYIEACTSNTGTIVARHFETADETWYDWTTENNTGTGIQDDQVVALYFGNYVVTSNWDGYIYNLYIGPYSAVWPRYGFERRPVRRPY